MNDKPPSFDFTWSQIVAHIVLSREEIFKLMNKLGVGVFESDKEKLSHKDLVVILFCADDDPEFVPSIREVVETNYPHLLTYEEAKQIYEYLNTLDLKTLANFFSEITTDEKLKSITKDIAQNDKESELESHDIIYWILEEFYKLPKEEVYRLLKEKLQK